MWYGLYKDGELRKVEQFDDFPSIFDFQCYITSASDYEIHVVEVFKVGEYDSYPTNIG